MLLVLLLLLMHGWIPVWLLTSSSNQRSEPRDDDGRATGTLQKGKHREDHHDTEAINGYTVARGVSENSRGSSF
jgi:hypothetical protein